MGRGAPNERLWEKALIVPSWVAPASVRAFTTTRLGGFSQGPYQGFNLALHVGDDPLQVLQNRKLLAVEAALPAEPFWLDQVHGHCVLDHPAEGCLPSIAPKADASVAFEPAQVCAVFTADCLPVLLCDSAGTCVAAVHAGWRGLCAGIIEAAVERIKIDPTHLMAWLGPAISVKHYEVGADVFEAFKPDERAQGFVKTGTDKWHCDLYVLARKRLKDLGLRAQAISGGDYCTYADPRFYSYRRSGLTGRMVTLIWLEAS
ncbi:MAG: peptidoglycan editing factor PgeF [Gammaproteobacteria bacterium]|nr:peptidoglycan editing factor PgeF [Gammaproteobacteria bacterium]MBP9729117.1 peptidoglycan editing factor PgeF [Gammaproteobacteria bacterium]